jgi:hypothetical protein
MPSRVAGIVTQIPKLRPPTGWWRKAASTEAKSCFAERTVVLRQNPEVEGGEEKNSGKAGEVSALPVEQRREWNVYTVTLSALLEAAVEEVLSAEPSWANSC